MFVLLGCKEQGHREYTDFIRGSTLPDGLYGPCAGVYNFLYDNSTQSVKQRC